MSDREFDNIISHNFGAGYATKEHEMDTNNMPDITKAQIVAVSQAALTVLVAFGIGLTDAQFAALMGLSSVVAGMLCHSDKGIRQARNERASSEQWIANRTVEEE